MALSTTEAEYVALSSTAQESLWLQQLLADLTKEPTKSMVIYEDKQSAIIMAKDPQFDGRSKHMELLHIIHFGYQVKADD